MSFSEKKSDIFSFLKLGSELYPLMIERLLARRYLLKEYPEELDHELRDELASMFKVIRFGDLPKKFSKKDLPNRIYKVIETATNKKEIVEFVKFGFTVNFWWEVNNHNKRKLKTINKELENRIENIEKLAPNSKELIKEVFRNYKKENYNKTIIYSILSILSRIISVNMPKDLLKDKELESKKYRILYLSADPKDTNHIKLADECKTITSEFESATLNDIYFSPILEVDIEELTKILVKTNYNIVHFNVESDQDNIIMLNTKTGEYKQITPDVLGKLFSLFKDEIQCVVLNTCYSEDYAEAISKHIEYVIGTGRDFNPDLAVQFSRGFYRALGEEKGFEEAIKFGDYEVYEASDGLYENVGLIRKKSSNKQNIKDSSELKFSENIKNQKIVE